MKTKMFKYRFFQWNQNKKKAEHLARAFFENGMFSRLTESACGSISVTCICEKGFTKEEIEIYEKIYSVCLVESEKVKV